MLSKTFSLPSDAVDQLKVAGLWLTISPNAFDLSLLWNDWKQELFPHYCSIPSFLL
jgi:hypothetical protein